MLLYCHPQKVEKYEEMETNVQKREVLHYAKNLILVKLHLLH